MSNSKPLRVKVLDVRTNHKMIRLDTEKTEMDNSKPLRVKVLDVRTNHKMIRLDTEKTEMDNSKPLRVKVLDVSTNHKMIRLDTEKTEMDNSKPLRVKVLDVRTNHKMIRLDTEKTELEPFRRHLDSKGNPYPKRDLTLMRDGYEVTISLWKEANLTELHIGTPVRLSHLIKKTDGKGGVVLNSTNTTDVWVVEGTFPLEVQGVMKCPGGDVAVLDKRDIAFQIPGEMWHQAFSDETQGVLKHVYLCYKDGALAGVSAKDKMEEEEEGEGEGEGKGKGKKKQDKKKPEEEEDDKVVGDELVQIDWV